MMVTAELKYHPAADIFPLLEGQEFESLCRDICQNGLLEPIWTYHGEILDGRNRYRACLVTETEPRFREYEGRDPVPFVVSLNLHRRHLSESQRAMVAARIATLSQGARTDIAPIGAMSQSEAADMLNVGRRAVQRATHVQNNGDEEVIKAVERGDVKVSAAEKLIDLPKEQQREILTNLLEEAGAGNVTSTRIDKALKVLAGETTNIHVSDDSYEWYTPKKYIDAAIQLMGGIDLDPATSDDAQKIESKRNMVDE